MIKLKIKQFRLIKDKLSDVPSFIYDYQMKQGDLLILESDLLYLESHSRMLIWGSIGFSLAMKIGGEAKAHEISMTQKWFGHILTDLGDIKIIKIFNGVPTSKLRKNKILMDINIKLG